MFITYTKSFTDDQLKVPNDIRPELAKSVELLKEYYPIERPNKSERTALEKIFLLPFSISGDWVIVYSESGLVEKLDLYMVGRRAEVLGRLRLKNNDTPNAFLISTHPDLLKISPTPDQQSQGLIECKTPEDQNYDTKYEVKNEHLKLCGIQENKWQHLRGERTISALLNIPTMMPNEVTSTNITELIQLVRPAPIEEIEGQPKYELANTSALSDPERLQQSILQLDPDQRKIVQYFKNKSVLKGEWSVTGGPGTGKTVLLIHLIHELLNKPNGHRYKILFTSYTNAVVSAASIYLDNMLSPSLRSRVTCKSIYKVAWEAGNKYSRSINASPSAFTKKIRATIHERKFGLLIGMEELVEKEIIWSLIDNQCKNVNEYYKNANSIPHADFDRVSQDLIWEIYKEIQESDLHCWHEKISVAAQNASETNKYDFVFYDEAQDVHNSGIKLLKKIVKDKNIFIAYDENQSIFAPRSSGFLEKVWKFFGEIGRFVGLKDGKDWNLSTNHRCTSQICNAINNITKTIDIKQISKNWLGKTIKEGPRPVIARCNNDSEACNIAKEFIKTRTTANKLGLTSAFVLCDKPKDVALKFSDLKAKAFISKTFANSWKHNGIKTCYIQSCKGLDLPVVILYGLTNNNLCNLFDKSEKPLAKYRREHAERVLLTALSRTTTDLLIITYKQDEPSFIKKLDSDLWEFIN